MIANSDITRIVDSVENVINSIHSKCLDRLFYHGKPHLFHFFRRNDTSMSFLASMFHNLLGSFMISTSDITSVVKLVETGMKSTHI
jgi:hypothetical protein